jgi:hypothetical protein
VDGVGILERAIGEEGEEKDKDNAEAQRALSFAE